MRLAYEEDGGAGRGGGLECEEKSLKTFRKRTHDISAVSIYVTWRR